MRSCKELFDLHGRTALITGGAGYLGQTFATSLAELGACLALVDVDTTRLEQVAENIRRQCEVTVQTYAVDLANDNAAHVLPAQVAHDMNGFDILINNAAFVGTSGLQGWGTDYPSQCTDTWRKALELNMTAPFTLCRESASFLQSSGYGSIINICSMYGVYGPDLRLYEGTSMGNPAAYAASKGGLVQLTHWLSTVLAPNIRVNSISPGGVWRNQPESFVQKYTSRTPLKRMATEEDFKGVIAWLASDASAYVTGQNIMIDGGWGTW